MGKLTAFVNDYLKAALDREAQGIPPLPLDDKQTTVLCELIQEKAPDPKAFVLDGQKDTVSSLLYLLTERVPPGVTDASFVKADFLGSLVQGKAVCPHISTVDAVQMLGQMGGGANIPYLVEALEHDGDVVLSR